MIHNTHVFWAKRPHICYVSEPIVSAVGDFHFSFSRRPSATSEKREIYDFCDEVGFNASESMKRAHVGRDGENILIEVTHQQESSPFLAETMRFNFFPHISCEGVDSWILDLTAQAVLFAYCPQFENLIFSVLAQGWGGGGWASRRSNGPAAHFAGNWKCETTNCLEMGYVYRAEQQKIICGACLFEEIKQSDSTEFFKPRRFGADDSLYQWAIKHLDLRERPTPRPFPFAHYERLMTPEYEDPAFERMMEFARQDSWFKQTSSLVPVPTDRELAIRQFCDFPMEGK